MNSIVANPVMLARFYDNKSKCSDVPKPVTQNNENTESFSGAQILADQNMAFLSKKNLDCTDETKPLPEYDKRLVTEEPEGHHSFYLRNNPEGFYNKHGLDINKFLRTGYLEPVEEEEDVPAIYKDFVEGEINEKKDYNRAIVDSVGILDSMMTSKSPDIMVLYTHVPSAWTKADKGAVVEEKGFFHATTVDDRTDKELDADDDYMQVIIPENMPFLDLTDKGKYVMLFPRGLQFSVIDNKNIEMLSNK